MPQIDVFTEPPPKPTDVPLRIYSNPICPYAQRVRLIAAAKNIRTEEINIHLKVKPQWYLDKINPYGKVPVIEHEGRIIRESLVASDYVDEVFPGKSLWPTDPYHKALDKLLLNDFGSEFTGNYYKYSSGNADENTAATLVKFVQRLEGIVTAHEGGFLSGKDAPRAVDYLLWPWFERLGAAKKRKPEIAALFPDDKFPVLYGWISRMKEDRAVKESLLSDEAHLAFIKGAVDTGKHDYSHADRTGQGVTIYTRKE